MEDNPFSLKGKNILVTGASSGIGRGISIACARMRGTILLNGRNTTRLNETLSMLDGQGHAIFPADLTEEDERSHLVDSLPQLDGVVHCAGVNIRRKMCKQLVKPDLQSVMGINFDAPVLLQAQLLRKRKVKEHASIVFISSLAVDYPIVANSVYSASKGAITSYANCLSLELAPRRIRVNSIHPAMIMTDMVFSGGFGEEEFKADEQLYPLKRYGTPEDIAWLVVYLLADVSDWMTGSHLNITGGLR